MKLWTGANLACLTVYLAGAAALVWYLGALRGQVIAEFSTSEQQQYWDQWREDAAKTPEGPNPVVRKPPGSPEPPALVLMRDYYGVVLGGALLFGTALYVALLLALRGALAGCNVRFQRRSAKDEGTGGRGQGAGTSLQSRRSRERDSGS